MRKIIENKACHAPYIETFFQRLSVKYLSVKGGFLKGETGERVD